MNDWDKGTPVALGGGESDWDKGTPLKREVESDWDKGTPINEKEPSEKRETFISAAPSKKKPSLLSLPKRYLRGEFESREAKIARSQNIYAISKTENLPMDYVGNNYSAITKELELRDYPTTTELIGTMLTLPLAAGAVMHPIGLAKGLIGFKVLDEIGNFIVSKIKKQPHKFGASKGLKELLPVGKTPSIEDTVDIIDFVGKAAILGGVYKKAPAVGQKLTKNISNKYNLPKKVYISANKIKDIFRTGKKINEYEMDLVKSLELTGKQYKKAIDSGLEIEVPVEKVVSITDKPYWRGIKRKFKIKPYNETKVLRAVPTEKFVKGYLPEPAEVIKPIPETPPSTPKQITAIHAIYKKLGIPVEKYKEMVIDVSKGRTSISTKLTKGEASRLIGDLDFLRNPPPKSPPTTKSSPGIEPLPKTPSEITSEPLPEMGIVKSTIHALHKAIDIQAKYNAVGAPETGFHIKNYYSYRETIEDLAHHIVGKMSHTKLIPSEWADVTYYTAQPNLMKRLDKRKYDVFAGIVNKSNSAFFHMLKKQKDAHTFVDPWPLSQIKREGEDIIHKTTLIEDVKKSDTPEGIKKERIERLKQEIREAKVAIAFLKAEDIHYVHIPTRLWFGKALKENPALARKVMYRYFKKRETVDIKSLAEHLKKEGLITDEDIDIRNIVAAYYQLSGHKIALSKIINSAMKEGLIVDADKQRDWPQFSPRWAPELKGKHIHPAFLEFVDEFTAKSTNLPLWRVLTYFKMTQFTEALFMGYYDLQQAFWLGSMRSIKTPLYIKKAIKSMATKGETYQKLMEEGLASRPYTTPFDNFMKSIEMAKKGNDFVGRTIAFLKGEFTGVKEAHPFIRPFRLLAIPIDAIYKPIWHVSWAGDRLVRLMSAHYLLDNNYTYHDAAQIAAKFHSDYASVPRKTGRILHHTFLTPIFPITMGKAQGEMILAAGKVLAGVGKHKTQSRRTKAMAAGLLGLIGLVTMRKQMAKMMGYKEDIFGYRWSKEVVDEEGNDKQLTISTSTPDNVLLRYIHTFKDWPTSPEDWGYYTRKVSWKLLPSHRVLIMLATNLRADGKTPIYNPFADTFTVAKNIVSWGAGELVRIMQTVTELPQTKEDKRAALSAFRDDVGKFWSIFLKPSISVYLRTCKKKQKIFKARKLTKEFINFTTKFPLKEDEQERAKMRFQRELQAIKEAE